MIRDPWAVTLLDAIDYDYDKFGRPSQVHALRALAFDAATRAYLTTHPKASVVALAEGLQTSVWRLDRVGAASELTWYSVDLPPVMALPEQLLPRDERIVEVAQSALDRSWMDRVDDSGGAIITAEGLLMYLGPEDALGLIRDCADRFPGGQMMFDSIPPWFGRRTIKGLKLSNRYITPPMPFALTADEGVALADPHPRGAGCPRYRLAAWTRNLQASLLAAAGPHRSASAQAAQHHAARVRLTGLPSSVETAH